MSAASAASVAAPDARGSLRDDAVRTLRARLDAVVPTAHPAGPAWPTGLPALDRRLGGGLPRGRLTHLVGPRSGGKTSLTRDVVAGVLAAGRWVAIIDTGRTLAPRDWAGLGDRLLVVRPPDPERAPWCADRLLRTGLFALVVLDHPPLLGRAVAVRLGRLARDRDAALLVVETEGAGRAQRLLGALRLTVRPDGHVRAATHPGSVRLPYVPPAPRRLRADPLLADRRGAAGHWDAAARAAAAAAAAAAAGSPGTGALRADAPRVALPPPLTVVQRHRRRAATPRTPFGVTEPPARQLD